MRRLVLVLLRSAALGVLLLLLLRPVLVAEYQGERPRSVALLIDNSQSMKQQDRRLSAADRLRVAIAEDLLPPDSALESASLPSSVACPAAATMSATSCLYSLTLAGRYVLLPLREK